MKVLVTGASGFVGKWTVVEALRATPGVASVTAARANAAGDAEIATLMPATGLVMGTPASISASVPPHTDAMLDEPFDSVISETSRIV